MKPIKLKELLRTAKDPATQRIVIDEGLWFDAPLFEGVVKDVDEALGERIISNWQVETDTYIIDIGGYTTDVVKFSRGGQVDMTFCESFNNGVIKMYDEVQRAVRNRFQLDMDDYSIDNVLRRGYNPGREINELVHSTARSYARTLIRTLKEKGVDLTLSYPVFIGGGSCLMRPVIESEFGRDDYLFVEDPRANAVGFKMMAESKLAAENR